MDRMRPFTSPLQAAGEALFDCAYGLILVAVREVHRIGSAIAMQRGLRVGWRLVRIAVIATLLMCAAHGAGWF